MGNPLQNRLYSMVSHIFLRLCQSPQWCPVMWRQEAKLFIVTLKTFKDLNLAHTGVLTAADPTTQTYYHSHKHYIYFHLYAQYWCSLCKMCVFRTSELSNLGNPARLSPLIWACFNYLLSLGMKKKSFLHWGPHTQDYICWLCTSLILCTCLHNVALLPCS